MKIITIGRNPRLSDIVINDPTVSGVHLQILQNEKGTYFVNDLDSLNGTTINGQVMPKKELMPLQHNDIVRIGSKVIPWRKYFQTSIRTPVSEKTQETISPTQRAESANEFIGINEEILKDPCKKKHETHFTQEKRTESAEDSGLKRTVPRFAEMPMRIFAFIVDIAICGVLTFGLYIMGGLYFDMSYSVTAFLAIFIGTFIVYHSIFEYTAWQATLGKKMCAIKVLNTDYEKAAFINIVFRNLIKIISVGIVGLGCFMAFFTTKKQAAHDWFANTITINSNI